MNDLVAGETSVRGDAPANHAGGAGSIPVSRSNKFQDFSDLNILPIDYDTAKNIIIQNHYSQKWNSAFGTENFGIFKNNNLLGVAVYGNPMNTKSWPTITTVNPNTCLELNRLWIDDSLLKNTETWFLKRTMIMLKNRGYRLIQSFADGRLGVGTMYQAANFGYYGFHTSLFHRHKETGEVFHDVPFTNTGVAKPMLKKNLLHVEGVLESFWVKTYRYLMPLDKAARRSILLKPEQYPKSRDGFAMIDGYVPPLKQMCRAAAIAKKMFLSDNFEVLRNYVLERDTNADFLIDQELQNEWIQKIEVDVPLF